MTPGGSQTWRALEGFIRRLPPAASESHIRARTLRPPGHRAPALIMRGATSVFRTLLLGADQFENPNRPAPRPVVQ